MDDEVLLIRKAEVFKDISPEYIRNILDIARRVTFSAGQEIVKEGDSGDTMYIMLTGTVEVIKSLVIKDLEDEQDGDKNKVFTRLNAENHAVFGEMSLLEVMKRTATIKAVTECTLYEIKKDDFLALAENNYELAYRVSMNLARIVSARLRKADEETIKLTTALSFILKEL
ncbi:MAG: cyclic nucleotide-binding domain-containing protein [Syntrophales bacterium]|nr:cyclic nucleotide-binding domain-containing protein [Syntrophales bacterium]